VGKGIASERSRPYLPRDVAGEVLDEEPAAALTGRRPAAATAKGRRAAVAARGAVGVVPTLAARVTSVVERDRLAKQVTAREGGDSLLGVL
jgi:hypothetical protein